MAAVNEPGAGGRALGVDLGERRIGLALSDPGGVIASPHSVLRRGRDRAGDHRAILAVARDEGVVAIVVGLPRSLSGGLGPAARAALAEIDELRASAGACMTVEACDERFTTVVAERALVEGGVRRQDRRAVVDKVAAAVMLQSWLDARRRAVP
ncbi:MAG: Holliday junction resolvase RuvX [Acidimicrobiia bacterium]|nr:Holliday junction resolvase RuvX [Acidimicrobiia bacterium]